MQPPQMTHERLENCLQSDRSYIIGSDGATYRWNIRQLRSTPEHYNDGGWDSQQQEPDNTRADNENAQLRAQDLTSSPCCGPPVAASPQRNEPPVNMHSPLNVPSPRQSPRDVTVARFGRVVKPPVKFKDYNMK